MKGNRPETPAQLTVVLFPHGKGGGARTITLSYRTLKIVAASVATGGFLWLLSFIVAVQFAGERIEKIRLESSNAKLMKAVGEMRLKFVAAKESLARVEAFAEKLRVMTDFPADDPASGSRMSMGGPSEGERAQELVTEGEVAGQIGEEDPVIEDTESLDGLKAGYERLEQKLKKEENSLEKLHSFLKDRQTLLSSTPSIWPTRGWLASGFGYRTSPFTGLRQLHQGVDIATYRGTQIVAPADGIVNFAGVKKGYGKVLILDHGFGIRTKYGHNSDIYVKQGASVKRGMLIAKVGSTGRSTGPHLHYEVWVNDAPVDPLDFILN